MLTNAYVGMREVDREAVEAARGMGMSTGQLVRRVELPLAFPLIAAGVRSAVLQVLATAVLAAAVGGGGLGRWLIDGLGSAGLPAAAGRRRPRRRRWRSSSSCCSPGCSAWSTRSRARAPAPAARPCPAPSRSRRRLSVVG